MKYHRYRLLHGFKCIAFVSTTMLIRSCPVKKIHLILSSEERSVPLPSVHTWHYSFTWRLLCTVVILKVYSVVDNRLRVWDGKQNIKPGSGRLMIYELVLGWVKWPMGPTAKIYWYLHCMCWEHFISNT